MAKDEKRKTAAGDEAAGNRKPKRGKAGEEAAQQSKHAVKEKDSPVEQVEEALKIDFAGKAVEQSLKKSPSDVLTAFSTLVGGGSLIVMVGTKVKKDSKNNVQGSYIHCIDMELKSQSYEVCQGSGVQYVGSFDRVNQGQYGGRDSSTYLLSSPTRSAYKWRCMLFLLPEKFQIHKLLSGAAVTFNMISKAKAFSDRFDAGEVYTEESKPLSYYISEEDSMKIMRNFFSRLSRTQIMKQNSILSSFFSSAERGKEVLSAVTDEEYEED